MVQNSLDLICFNIGNAFPTAPCVEKIWFTAGAEFESQEDSTVVLKSALYGLKTASKLFHDFLGGTFERMGFRPSQADQDLWI